MLAAIAELTASGERVERVAAWAVDTATQITEETTSELEREFTELRRQVRELTDCSEPSGSAQAWRSP